MAAENGDALKRLKDLEELVSSYEGKLFLDKINIVEVDLSISREVLMKMDYMDIRGLIWDYGRYILGLQKEINKQTARYNWAESNLKRCVEKESPQYEGFKWEERQANALSSNEYAQKLFQLKTQSKFLIDRTSFLVNKIEFLSKIASDIAYTKSRYSHENRD